MDQCFLFSSDGDTHFGGKEKWRMDDVCIPSHKNSSLLSTSFAADTKNALYIKRFPLGTVIINKMMRQIGLLGTSIALTAPFIS